MPYSCIDRGYYTSAWKYEFHLRELKKYISRVRAAYIFNTRVNKLVKTNEISNSCFLRKLLISLFSMRLLLQFTILNDKSSKWWLSLIMKNSIMTEFESIPKNRIHILFSELQRRRKHMEDMTNSIRSRLMVVQGPMIVEFY